MRYQRKSAIAYFFRNFWRLVPMSLAAAALLGFFANYNAQILLIRGVIDGSVNNENVFDEIFRTVSVLHYGKYWWGILVAIAVFALTESLLAVKVFRHMRMGNMPHFPINHVGDVIPTMSLFVVGVFVVIEILNLIVVGIAFLLRSIGTIPLVVVTFVLLFLAQMFVMWAVGMLLFAFPIMAMENYNFNQALSYSVRLMSDHRKFLFCLALFYPLVQYAITAICGIVNIYYVTVAAFGVFYLFCIAYVPCVTFALYYDSVGGERRDISRKIF